MTRTAVLIDGNFFLKRAAGYGETLHPKSAHRNVMPMPCDTYSLNERWR